MSSNLPLEPQRSWRQRFGRLGPTIVVAAVVLGPGSIVNASRVGCEFGFSLLWVVPLAGILMAGMTIAAMTTGVLDSKTPCTRIAEKFGRPAAFAVGACLFVAITLYQASNNNAMIMALEGVVPNADISPVQQVMGLGVFNALVIALLLAGQKGMYRKLERTMTVLVGIMLLAFAASMVAAKPAIVDIAGGLIPQWPTTPASTASSSESAMVSWLGIAALIATTFSVAGAFFQNYQVREKAWQKNELKTGVLDAVVGIGTLSVMTMILFITAASALHGTTPVSDLSNATAVASAMEPMFGRSASLIFSIGVMAGAISSFVVNALIGGVALVDAVGKSCAFDSVAVRRSTIVALLAGFAVAALATLTGMNLVRFIVVAQSLTVLAFPVLATTILWHLWSIRDRGVSKSLYVPVMAGTFLVYAMSVRTIWGLIGS